MIRRLGKGIALVDGAQNGAALAEDALDIVRSQTDEFVLFQKAVITIPGPVVMLNAAGSIIISVPSSVIFLESSRKAIMQS